MDNRIITEFNNIFKHEKIVTKDEFPEFPSRKS